MANLAAVGSQLDANEIVLKGIITYNFHAKMNGHLI
jgi:hypothetical protein